MTNSKKIILILLTLFLFIIPFFWLQAGEMDLGGDAHRLYFYDPLSNLKAFAIYGIAPWGTANIAYNQFFIPYLLFLALLKVIFVSPTILIDIFNGLKLGGSFLFIFLIVAELIKSEKDKKISSTLFFSGIIAGLFYSFSSAVLDNMKYALFTHDLVFLSPLIVFLLIKYLKTRNIGYIWFSLLTTLIFSSSFSLQAPPPIFAFYPLTILFLLLYNKIVLKKSFPFNGIILFSLFFLGLHAFHVIPVLTNIFDQGSEFNNRVFEGFSQKNIGLEYFDALVSYSKLSQSILVPLENNKFDWSLSIVFFLMIFGLLSNVAKVKKLVLLVSIFFFITLFLKTGNITNTGVLFYKGLFFIPGFGMFRNFSGQWQFVFNFFYALFVGILTYNTLTKLKPKYTFFLVLTTIVVIFYHASIIFTSNPINVLQRGSNTVRAVIKMDPHYEKTLAFIKNISDDGRILHIPFTDFAYNLVGGVNNGVYVGQSMTSLLDGRNDFAGYQHIDPYSETFVRLSREKNFLYIKHMLALLQVRYILYNSDKKVSDRFFPDFPYKYNGTPASPSASLSFVKKITDNEVYHSGNYTLFEVSKDFYLPNFYIPTKIILYDINPKYQKQYFSALSFYPPAKQWGNDSRIAFLDRYSCQHVFSSSECKKSEIDMLTENIFINFQKVNPTKYKIRIENKSHKPFLLVFQSAFSSHWKVYPSKLSFVNQPIIDTYFNKAITEWGYRNNFDMNPFETNTLSQATDLVHLSVNGYANTWYFSSKNARKDNQLTIEMNGQKIFYYSLITSLVSFIIFISYGLLLLKKRYE